MADGTKIGTGYIQVMPEMKDFTKAVKSQTGSAMESEGEQAGSSFSTGLKTGLKVVGTAFTTATAGAVKLSKEVVSAYGDYEQLAGGVQKIFGDMDYQAVIENASDAFQTAGLSANDYMESVTGFSASLISSLEGDTRAAVGYADKAITDMSDNANTFGTDIESIQYAYQGFAKQNYTMLDNLKLGYGGTKTEMERLVTDAEKLDSSFQATRDSNGQLSLSFSDVVDAIHIVQENMGIAGTTAKEASSTIEGSLNTMKAAWENLLTGMGDSNADINKLTTDFTESFQTAVNNIEPVLENLSSALPEVIGTLMDAAADILPGLIVTLLPAVVTGMVKLAASLVSHIPEIIGGVAQGLIEGIIEVITGEDVDWFGGVKTQYSDMIDEMSEKHQEFVTALDNAQSTYDNTIAATEGNAAAAQYLMEKLQGLVATYDGTAEKSGIIAGIVEQLNDLVPGLGLAWDGVTGSLNLTNQEIYANIEAMKQQAATAALQELYTETLKASYEVQQRYASSQEHINELLKQSGLEYDQIDWAMQDNIVTVGELNDIWGSTDLTFQEKKVIAKELTEAFQAWTEAGDDLGVSQDTLAWIEEQLGIVLAETSGSIGEHTSVLETLRSKYNEIFGMDIPKDLGVAISSAEQAGVEIPQSLVDGILNGSISVESAIDQIVELMNQSAQAAEKGTETGEAYVEAAASVVVDERTTVGAAAKTAVAELDTSDEAYGYGSEAGAGYDSGLASQEGNVTATASGMAADVVNEFAATPAEMNAAGSESGSGLNSGFGGWSGTVSATIDGMYNFFHSTLGTLLPPLMSTWGSTAGQKYNSGLNLWSGDIGSTAQSIADSVETAVSGLPDEMSSIGSMAGQGLYNGLAAWQGSLSSMAWSIANSINAAARSALKIKSPSRVMMEVGEFAVEGLASGIEDRGDGAVKAMKVITTDVIKSTGGLGAGVNREIMNAAADRSMNPLAGTAGRSEEIRQVYEYLDRIHDMLEKISRMKVVMDSGELVGVIAPKMNEEFEAISQKERRG